VRPAEVILKSSSAGSLPRDGPAFGNQVVEQAKDSLDNGGRIEKLDDQWQIDQDTQNVRGVDLPGIAKTGDSPENCHASHSVLVVQNVQDLLHERLTPTVICFADINANDCNLGFHGSA
jgi:hypothetical protein